MGVSLKYKEIKNQKDMNYFAGNLNTQNAIKTQFLAEVEFGIPSKKCKNFGICRITPIGKHQTEQPKLSLDNPKKCMCKKNKSCAMLCACKFEGIISLFEDQRVEMCFLRAGIKNTNFIKYFGSGSFLVEEEYSFQGKEPVNINFKIKKGMYSVALSKTLIKVFFNA